MHDRITIVFESKRVAAASVALFELLSLSVSNVVPKDLHVIVSVAAFVGVEHSDAVKNLRCKGNIIRNFDIYLDLLIRL